MPATNVVKPAAFAKAPAAKKTANEKKPSAKAVRADRLARAAAWAPLAIFAAGLTLSLSHQAHGVINSTTVEAWEGWATALEIDCGFLAAKGLPYFARNAAEQAAVERWTRPLAVACFLLCAYFNASGYCGYVPAGAVRVAIGVTLGCFVPGVMLAMSMVSRILAFGAK